MPYLIFIKRKLFENNLHLNNLINQIINCESIMSWGDFIGMNVNNTKLEARSDY